jgi:hypothetical protein
MEKWAAFSNERYHLQRSWTAAQPSHTMHSVRPQLILASIDAPPTTHIYWQSKMQKPVSFAKLRVQDISPSTVEMGQQSNQPAPATLSSLHLKSKKGRGEKKGGKDGYEKEGMFLMGLCLALRTDGGKLRNTAVSYPPRHATPSPSWLTLSTAVAQVL